MQRVMTSKILLIGLNGLGVEIAKNVILTGVKSVSLYDTALCRTGDLAANFYLSQQNMGQNRAEAW